MGRLFNRDVVVTIGSKRIASRPKSDPEITKPTLRIRFRINKSLGRDPNTAELTLWNLSEESRAAFQEEGNPPVVVEAGYVDETTQVFSGDLFRASNVRNGLDWETTIEVGDGAASYRKSRISESFGPGTSVEDVVNKIVDSMKGLGAGNVLDKLGEGSLRGGVDEFSKGRSIVGLSAEKLDEVLSSAGIDYSIQDGMLQALKPNETTGDDAVQLDAASGLIGSPELGDSGVVKARSLLQGAIAPGRRIEIRAVRAAQGREQVRFEGAIRVEHVTHVGDTWETDWYTNLEGEMIA